MSKFTGIYKMEGNFFKCKIFFRVNKRYGGVRAQEVEQDGQARTRCYVVSELAVSLNSDKTIIKITSLHDPITKNQTIIRSFQRAYRYKCYIFVFTFIKITEYLHLKIFLKYIG